MATGLIRRIGRGQLARRTRERLMCLWRLQGGVVKGRLTCGCAREQVRNTASVLARQYGVTGKAIRDVWTHKVWRVPR